ncbi:AT-hook motif nuclear-localized protein 17 [Euphorbia peplus]|nr:AT-hook motif nuclear-localized protein 17 [Euphorbia peplus]
MKGEYLDSQSQHQHVITDATKHEIFSKLHPHHPFSHHLQDDATKPSNNNPTFSDGATIEVGRRPRGRPPGSKNKPKPPPTLLHDPQPPPMTPYILEVPPGADLVDAIARFSRRKNIGICVLTGSGSVANVTLRQPSTTPPATITFHGRFDILSISATFMPQRVSYSVPNGFTISLAGPQGQIVGGIVAGTLVAATTVYVIAATFSNPSFYRLPVEDEDVEGSNSGQSPAVSGGGGGGGDSCGMVMYSTTHLPSDVIWAPTARPPPPPY